MAWADRLRGLLLAMAMLCASTASGWVVPLSFTVSGQVGAPKTDTVASLRALPQSTQTVTYRTGSGTVTDTFSGPTLYNVLQAAGGITTNSANKTISCADTSSRPGPTATRR